MNALRELPALSANLRKLAGIASRVARKAAPRLTQLIQTNTRAGLDAYARPFAPLAASTLARGRTPPPMIDSGRSLAETRAYPLSGAGIGIALGEWYGYHVQATTNRPARSVLPERSGMPAQWRAALTIEADRDFASIMGGR